MTILAELARQGLALGVVEHLVHQGDQRPIDTPDGGTPGVDVQVGGSAGDDEVEQLLDSGQVKLSRCRLGGAR